MATPCAAYNAQVRINSLVMVAGKWEVTPENQLIDTTNFEGGGYEEQVTGVSKCEFTIEGWWNKDINMFDAAPGLGLNEGALVSNVRLYLNAAGTSVYWYFPFAHVKSAKNVAEVKDAIKYVVQFKGNGSFTKPTGITP